MNNNIYLCKPGGDVVAALAVDEDTVLLTESVGELWELSFSIHRYRYGDGAELEEIPYYDSLAEMMELFLDSENCKARFLIDSAPVTNCDGTAETKTVTAHSVEAELQYKFLENFQVNTGKEASQENLVKGNLLGEPVDITDSSQILYDYNLNPYTNLPVDYITVICSLGEELAAFRSQFQKGIEPSSIRWIFSGDTEETVIPVSFSPSAGKIIGDPLLLLKWYEEFTNKFPRILSYIVWGRDKMIDSAGKKSGTYDTIICVTDVFLSSHNDGVYVPLPTYVYNLNGAGTEYEITLSSSISYSFDRFIDGLDRLIGFYEKFSGQLGLLGLVLEKAGADGWGVGNVPSDIAKKKYSFEVDKQDIYSFLMNNISHTMKVVIGFDRVNKKVNVIDLSGDDKEFETGIVAGFHNLLQTVDIQTSSTDGIKTTFIPKGMDNLGIEYVNFGNDRMTNLDYFINKVDKYGEYMYGTSDLHDKYKNWKRYRDEELTDITVPSYSFNINRKSVEPSASVIIGKTRREQYTELSKMYNQTLKDISDLTYLVPSDGAMTDYTTYNLKELQTVAVAYINAYNTLVELYKAEYGRSEIVESEIMDTYFYQDYKLYKYTIIPNVFNALKIYALTDADGHFLDENGDVTEEFSKLVYPDGGNPLYNGNAELVTKSKKDDYLYDMSLYGLSELNVKKKAWAASAAQIYKDAFVKSGTPGTAGAVYRSWAGIMADGLSTGFTGQAAYEKQLDAYLDYMSYTDRTNSLIGGISKGVVCLAIDAIAECEGAIAKMETVRDSIGELRNNIRDGVTYEGWGGFTDKELRILHTLSHEADYVNENIISTSLDDIVTIVDVQQELFDDAKKRLFEKSRPQYSFQVMLDNILALDGFAPMKEHLKLLNYFYLRYGLYDDETLKLRIIRMIFNPLIKTQELTLEFSNMTYTFEGVNDFYYLFDGEMMGGTSGGGSSSSGGGTYGTNDAEITLSNNMLNALLKNLNIANSLNPNNGLTSKQVETMIASGDIHIEGAAIVDEIKSLNYNGTPDGPEPIINNTKGSILELSEGKFNFGGGALKYNGTSLEMKGEFVGGIIKSQNYNGTSEWHHGEPPIIDNTQGSVLELTEGKFNFGGEFKYDGLSVHIGPWILSDAGLTYDTGAVLQYHSIINPNKIEMYLDTDNPGISVIRKLGELSCSDTCKIYPDRILFDDDRFINSNVFEYSNEGIMLTYNNNLEKRYRIVIDLHGIKKYIYDHGEWVLEQTYIDFDAT